MKSRIILAAMFVVLGLAAGWMAWLTWRAGDDGKWLFGVFAAFFLILAATPFLPASKKNKAPAEPVNTHFVPAWQMEGMILLALIAIIASVVAHCAHVVK